MFKFFKNFRNITIKNSEKIASNEVFSEPSNTFTEIEKLGKSNDIHDLKRALHMIDETQSKYPFCFDKARYLRGEISGKYLELTEDNQEPYKIIKK